ncbi:MAG: tetratricopeptide repeat protein [Bradymonadia bacterium]|jgi:tetratricopeptide (TPR) repeat protein
MREIWLISIIMVLFCAGSAFAQDGSEFNKRLDSLAELLTKERMEFALTRDKDGSASLDRRLQEGLVLFSGGQYERASYVFTDIVARDEWRGSPGYETALLMLGKSLHEDGYYRMAQNYLMQAFVQCKGLERHEAVAILLNVVQITGDWGEVNELMESLGDMGGDVIDYMRGRAYFLQNNWSDARYHLARLGDSGEFAMKGGYLLGVILIEEGKLDEAIAMFSRVSQQKERFRDIEVVRDLSILALARIYFERQQWSEAMDMYQQIGEKSPFFADVLYEMAWTNLRRGELQAGQQNLEILLISYPKSIYAAESKQLLADIEREHGRYDAALAGYQEIINKYEPVMNEMRSKTENAELTPARVREGITSGKLDQFIFVPAEAKELVPLEGEVRDVEYMLGALNRSEDNTQASREIIAEIEEILSGSMRYSIFPEYQRFWESARGIKINSLSVGAQINEAAYKKNTQSSLRDQRLSLVASLAQMPKDSHERSVARTKREAAISQRRAELYRLKLQYDAIKNGTQVIRNWQESGSTKAFLDEEREDIAIRLAKLEPQLERISQKQKEIERSINKLESYRGISEHALKTEDEIISSLESVIAREWQELNHDSYAKPHEKYLAQIQATDDYIAEIDAAITSRLAGIRERLAREAGVVADEEQRYGSSFEEVSETIADVAARYWNTVFSFVQDMVLGADLGIVDVAWLRKDERSKALSTLMDERKKEREILEQDFKQFLKESGKNASPSATKDAKEEP